MNLLEGFVKSLKKLKETWITPPDEPEQGFVQLRTADGKTAITVNIADGKDAHKAKQLVDLALQDTESYDDEPYHFGMVDMEE
ncbi:MAG: hypothetical protein II306_00145 [Clostridia bacterium]|nr:hypothetical protein [Treponema sp.]MBQ2151926.1 hypothetical protein [Clostridia bacterium]MBQ2390159.1 hypothetical protein [Clostridia bacterium]